MAPSADLPIGVFDSGVGGLSVVRALRAALPGEDFIYLGDTARLPYGSKSAETVRRYALQAAALLTARGIKALVVACNTATAAALPELQRTLAPMPVIGVLIPGATAAVKATRTGRVAVLATEGTVRAGAYARAIAAINPQVEVHPLACPLLVALAEEGWTQGPIVEAVVAHYLAPLLAQEPGPDVLVLGCTHFPVLAEVIAAQAGPGRQLVDSALTTADETLATLTRRGLLRPRREVPGSLTLLATDSVERFARVGSLFAAEAIDPATVELVDLSPR